MSETPSHKLQAQCSDICAYMKDVDTSETNYFRDWNILMRVVDKIESEGNCVTIDGPFCTICNSAGLIIASNVRDTKKWAVFHTVHAYIQKTQKIPIPM
jgi:hypothetical protein